MFKTLAFIALALGTSSAFAQGSGIGPAGCGLGNMAFGKDNQIFAATLNGTGGQVFAITSGTSNCDAGGRMAKMTMFIESNRIALANEAARGQGETVAALSELLGCQSSERLGENLKSNYNEIFARADNSVAISNSIQHSIQRSPALARTCQPLG